MSIEKILLEDMEKEALEDAIHDEDDSTIDQMLDDSELADDLDGVYPGKKIKMPEEMEELEILDLEYSEEELDDIDDGLGDLEDDIDEDDTKSELDEYFEDDEDEYIAGEEDELYDLFNTMDTLLEEEEN